MISAIQGPGASSPLAGTEVDIEAVVVGVFQKPGELGGLFVQEEDADQDNDKNTSEGLFVFTRIPARTADRVRIRGMVTEFEGLTELHPVSKLKVCAGSDSMPGPTIIHLPLTSPGALEAVENMRISLPKQHLVITDLQQLWKFGELVVSSERLFQPTQLAAPGEAAAKLAVAASRDRLIIDDGRTGRYLPVSFSGQDSASSFSADNPVRSGQAISGLEGVMHYAFGQYRLQATRPFHIDRTANPRTAKPEPVGGTLRASVFNVLNYFSTLDRAVPVCGPSENRSCRGAKSRAEQQRQMQKLTAALRAIDADILALVELENNPEQSLRDVVNALNSITGGEAWAYIPSGSIGQDAIKVGILFKPAMVTAVGRSAILNRAVDVRFKDTMNRPALAQTFRIQGSGELLTVVATHLRSKNCSEADGPDADQNDGQACFNRTRTEAATALADWATSDPTGSGSSMVLVLGDFNSYRMEDPIQAMQRKMLVDLLALFKGPEAYTYVYDGLAGTLDYAFGNEELAMQVTGVTVWHINADESAALDYRGEPDKSLAYQAGNPFRSSDHDPVIIGLNIGPAGAGIENSYPEEDSSALRYTWLAGALLLLLTGALGAKRYSQKP